MSKQDIILNTIMNDFPDVADYTWVQDDVIRIGIKNNITSLCVFSVQGKRKFKVAIYWAVDANSMEFDHDFLDTTSIDEVIGMLKQHYSEMLSSLNWYAQVWDPVADAKQLKDLGFKQLSYHAYMLELKDCDYPYLAVYSPYSPSPGRITEGLYRFNAQWTMMYGEWIWYFSNLASLLEYLTSE